MRRFLNFIGPEQASRLALLVLILASPAYYVCRFNHFCMAGHLQHEDERTLLAHLTDAGWVAGFVLAMWLLIRSGISFRYGSVFFFGFLFLSLMNWLLFSIPVHVVLCLLLLLYVKDWIE